jgi:hypothetical protein
MGDVYLFDVGYLIFVTFECTLHLFAQDVPSLYETQYHIQN